jgi:hypothetical protein
LDDPLPLGTIDQDVPFHCSESVVAAELAGSTVPTTQQFDSLKQVTPESPLSTEVSELALSTEDHAVPFHRSVNVWVAPLEPVNCDPTAQQSLPLTQVTPVRLAFVPLLSMDQVLPFQCS